MVDYRFPGISPEFHRFIIPAQGSSAPPDSPGGPGARGEAFNRPRTIGSLLLMGFAAKLFDSGYRAG
jgi:hypothetical protein